MAILTVQILCVEDCEAVGQAIKQFLDASGYKVTIAPTVDTALAMAKASSFDLYILDYKLPDGTGIELCRCIRDFDSTTPILIYSRCIDPQVNKLALSAGAQRCLGKGAGPELLKETVRELLRDQHSDN